jgi:hypothetical protein
LHPVVFKLLQIEYGTDDYKKYPLRLSGKIEEIEYDVLDLNTTPNNYHQKNF